MIIDIFLERRGMLLSAASASLSRGAATPLHAALAWWAITGGAFATALRKLFDVAVRLEVARLGGHEIGGEVG